MNFSTLLRRKNSIPTVYGLLRAVLFLRVWRRTERKRVTDGRHFRRLRTFSPGLTDTSAEASERVRVPKQRVFLFGRFKEEERTRETLFDLGFPA